MKYEVGDIIQITNTKTGYISDGAQPGSIATIVDINLRAREYRYVLEIYPYYQQLIFREDDMSPLNIPNKIMRALI